VTFHVEVRESPDERRETLARIREAGRLAGLAISPGTSVDALRPYADLLDIAMVMTVVPGAGGQRFLAEEAPRIRQARPLLARAADGGEVHVDGGVNRETAAVVGGLGADVLVVGSALFQRGRDTADEVTLVRRIARAAAEAGDADPSHAPASSHAATGAAGAAGAANEPVP
jgi:ribulose-phosphate 3-epimerase